MTSSDRRLSLSPNEYQRNKSRSSSQSHRTPPNIIIEEEDARREKTSSPASKPSARDLIPTTKRSESSTSNRSTTVTSPTSNISKKPRSSLKSSSPPPITNRRRLSKRKKSSISIAEIERRQLLEPNNEEKQDLTGRGFAMIPPEIFQLITLRRLILSYNNLSNIPPEIGLLINLEYLDISHNPLNVQNGRDDYLCFPRDFRHLRNLHTLILIECSLKHIPVIIWSIVSLQILDLSRNRVGYIVSEIGNLIELCHLRLSQMNLDTLPPEIGFCDKLETLDLTGNPIDNLPETLIECRQLYELKLNYQTFYKLLDEYMLKLIDEGKIRSEHIPQVIFELESLQILDLSRTKINSISNDHTLLNLSELYLSNNSFFDIPQSICTIQQLKILDLSHNRILTIPDYFIQLKQLEILNLSYNKLNLLPNLFVQLLLLKTLIINHNKLEKIQNEFSKCQSLLILDLSYNNLTTFSEELCQLEQLQTLDLRYNKIEFIPTSIRQMHGLRSMNTFQDSLQRSGLHLLGNSITDPPGYIWKSTDIQTLFNYIETKEKTLANSFYHLKLILLGPKNIGKTTFTIKLLNNHKIVTKTRNTIDMYVSILQQKQLQTGELGKTLLHQISNTPYTLSQSADQWIENRISTTDDYVNNQHNKNKRNYPPPLNTYRTNEISNYFLHKSTLITNNNFYFTLFDLANETNFEILYPLIYDSNALYILPVNLTILLNQLQTTISFENINEMEDQSTIIDFNTVLTYDWLYDHVYRYIESISDYCEKASIAIIGLIDNSQIMSDNQQQQQLLDEIHIKINGFLFDQEDQRNNIKLYSEYFPEPIHLDDEQMSSFIIEQLEQIAQQWNIIHHKQKREYVKQRFSFLQKNTLILDYDTCFKRYKQQQSTSSISEDDNDNPEEDEELKLMSFDQCLDYLKLIGDIIYFGPKSRMTILVKPYHILNKLLSSTLFRPQLDQWLNYDENMVFRFSGYYPTEDLFNIDRERLFTRGEFTWKMLNVLFYEQNNNSIGLTEKNIYDYCRLMERLYLGYLNESNLNHREFTTNYFVCPWLMKEKCFDIDYINYFQILEQERQYECLRRERSRKIKQQQLWFSMDNEQENQTNQHVSIVIPNLPSIHEIEISNSDIINQDPLQTIKILNNNSNPLPNGLYERLLICLHPLFNERLDYSNLTIGRTIEKNLIKIQRFDEQNQIHLTINNNLLERIQNFLLHTLFSFYPTINLRIET